jgi:3-carboxy-cis,cis-muconate cycloisomerase
MKPSSSPSDLLAGALFDDEQVDAALSDDALVAAMLAAEEALAAAAADAGMVPRDAADAIGAACRDIDVDAAELGREARSAGNPVPAIVRRLTAAVPETARPWVHHGATSQDVLDTALALVLKRALARVAGHLAEAGDECAKLARLHCDTVMIGRTLGQHAVPTTFGRKAAGWLAALDDAGDRVGWVCEQRLAAQLGGAVGTLAGYGDAGHVVVASYARRLDLVAPLLPWHSDRSRVLDVAAAAAAAASATGKIATDVVLMAQDEIAEVSLADAGESSAMPHKRNPVEAVLVRAAAMRVPGLVATLYAAADQEHERAAGGWHAEWAPLLELVRLVGGMTARATRMLAGLQVDADRMRGNVDRTGGLVMAEAVAARLAHVVGRSAAHEIVTRCTRRARDASMTFRDALREDADVARHLSPDEVQAALDPAAWLGSASAMVDSVVEAHRRR